MSPMQRGALFAAGLLSTISFVRPLAAQATNPPYLSEMPSVEKVKQAMRVGDPRETALRQVGAFYQLQELIKTLSGRREFRGYLPDEMKYLGIYGTAEYQVSMAADSAFPGPYKGFAKLSAYTPYRYGRSDPRFGVEGIELFRTLLTPNIQAQFDQIEGIDRSKIAARARSDSIDRVAGEQRMTQPAGASGQPQTQLEKEQAGIRRCVESGRSQSQCMTEGLGKSFMNMIGGSSLLGGLMAPIVGVRMIGNYPGGNKFSLDFSIESASLVCGDLVPQTLEYTTAMTPAGLRITFTDKLPPFIMRADGRLVGPAEADISGEVITGYQQGTRTWSDGRTEPISRPIYEPRTRHCTIGALTVSSSTAPLVTAGALPAAALGAFMGTSENKLFETSPTGIRITGEFRGQDGVALEFRPEGVVVGCRDAALLRQYLVRLQGSQVVVDVKHGTTPFTLTMTSDGKFTGTGTLRVDGRAMTGTNGNGELTYVPRSATCTLGTLAPGS